VILRAFSFELQPFICVYSPVKSPAPPLPPAPSHAPLQWWLPACFDRFVQHARFSRGPIPRVWHAGALLTNHFRALFFPPPPVITPHDPFFRRATLHGSRHVPFLRPRPCPSHFCSLTSGCHRLRRRRRWDQRRRRRQHRTRVLLGRILSAQHVAARESSTTTVLPLPPPKPPLTASLALMLHQRFGFSRLRSWPSPAEGACTRLRRHDVRASRVNFQRMD
jgi:hypothetical protein